MYYHSKMMIAIGWKAIWLFDSVQFDDNAAKHQRVKKKIKQATTATTKRQKYIKNKLANK